MSFFQKLLRRKSKSDVKELSNSGTDSFKTEEDGVSAAILEKRSNTRAKFQSMSERRLMRDANDEDDSPESDIDTCGSSEDFDERIAEHRKQKLKSQIFKLRRQRDKLRRRQVDVVSIEKEIREVILLTARAKQQAAALKEDFLNKKCELKFLASEAPEGYEIEAKKKEPVFYKKYCNVKTTSEASNLLVNVREKIKALHYIELLTYNKYIECKHDTKSSCVRHRSSNLSKNKKRHFGPLMDAMQFASGAEKGRSLSTRCAEQESDDTSLQTYATVTIEPSTPPEAPPTPPIQGPSPLLPAHLIRGPLALTSSAHMTPETMI